MPLRMVGTHEYLNAIGELSELVRDSSSEEIAAYNWIIGEQQEYAFFSGKFLGMEPSIRDTSPIEEVDKKHRFKKHSLQWMLALARVEIGASLAMYGHVDRAFEIVMPKEFGVAEYELLVADDAAAHMAALDSDAAVKKRVKKADKVDSDTIAYLRRMKVANDLLDFMARRLPEENQEMFRQLLSSLNKAREALRLQAEVATLDYHSSETNVGNYERSRVHRTFGRDIQARSPLTRACQHIFLNRHSER